MDCTFLVVCLAALVIPSLQFDDGIFSFKNSRLARDLGKLRRGGAKIRGNLEIVGPLGGVFEANLDGALGRQGNLFNAETRGHLRGGVRRRGPLGGVTGTAGAVEGVLKRGGGLLGAEVAGQLDHVSGNVFTGVRRQGVRGRVSAGAGMTEFSPFGDSPFGNSYTSGLIGHALTRREYY
ncbi:hypothetical protein PoB_006185600 [Plakobranchus ocellatus]|uniref:Uncharacterized protein n=1 Tax=Plakobranchus ocellatus TaxID=259542 RepID=A0AAV4CTV6_9GAST|nr:hypothetical protein PoB_006185600 [Plakobranchus ocellatus]